MDEHKNFHVSAKAMVDQEDPEPKDCCDGSKSSNPEQGQSKMKTILRQQDTTPTSSLNSSSHHNTVRFSMDAEVVTVPKFPIKDFSDYFYDEEEIAEFRYEAWCEECGFDPQQFQN